MRTLALALGLICLGVFASPAPAAETMRVFDDVEIFPIAPFLNLTGAPVDFAQGGIPFSSCMAQNRTVTVHPVAETELTSTGTDDWLVVKHSGFGLQVGSPIVTLEYDFAQPIDLTFGGEHDRFRMRMVNVEPGDISMQMEIESAAAIPGVPDGTVTTPVSNGQNAVLFGSFGLTAAQWNAVTRVRIHFASLTTAPSPPVTWRLSWIRLVGATLQPGSGIVASEDDGVIKPLVPVPPPPYQAEWTWTDPSGGPYEVMHTEISMLFGQYPGSVVLSSDVNGGSSLDMTVHSTAADIEPGRFIIGREFLPNGSAPALFYPPDRIHVGERLIVVLVHIELLPDSLPGAHGGHVYQRIRLEIPEDSPMVFENLLLDGFEGSNNVFMDFRVERQLGAVYGPGVAFSMNVQTEWRPEDVSTTVSSPFADDLSLSARPSVTSGATRFWLEQEALQDGIISIFDIRGRRVQTLNLAAGVRSVTWDGHDGQGRALASGRYYARVRGASGPAAVLTVVR